MATPLARTTPGGYFVARYPPNKLLTVYLHYTHVSAVDGTLVQSGQLTERKLGFENHSTMSEVTKRRQQDTWFKTQKLIDSR